MASTGNLLTNSSAESTGSPPPGWTVTSPGSMGGWTAGGTTPAAYAGARAFKPSAVQTAMLHQNMDISAYAAYIDAGLVTWSYSGAGASYAQSPADQYRQRVEFFTSDPGAAQGTPMHIGYDSGYRSSSGTWVVMSSSGTVPVGARWARVQLRSNRQTGGNNDGYHDALYFALDVPILDPVNYRGLGKGSHVRRLPGQKPIPRF